MNRVVDLIVVVSRVVNPAAATDAAAEAATAAEAAAAEAAAAAAAAIGLESSIVAVEAGLESLSLL